MSYKVPYFLKRDGDSLVCDLKDQEFIFFVPKLYFEKNIAIEYGEYISLIGMLDYTITDKKLNFGKIVTFNFPTIFLTSPGYITEEKNIKLSKYSQATDYKLLHYKYGDKVINSVKVPKVIVNCEAFYSLIFSGKLPSTIPYDKLHDYFFENIELNGGSYGINKQLFGIVIAELCRSSSDKSVLFRHTKMDNMLNYQMIPLKENAKLVSPMTAITSENIDESIVYASINKKPKDSPLEKLLL